MPAPARHRNRRTSNLPKPVEATYVWKMGTGRQARRVPIKILWRPHDGLWGVQWTPAAITISSEAAITPANLRLIPWIPILESADPARQDPDVSFTVVQTPTRVSTSEHSPAPALPIQAPAPAPPPPAPPTPFMPMVSLTVLRAELGDRAYNTLRRHGVATVEAAMLMDQRTLLRIRGMGGLTAARIERVLAKYRVTDPDAPDPEPYPELEPEEPEATPHLHSEQAGDATTGSETIQRVAVWRKRTGTGGLRNVPITIDWQARTTGRAHWWMPVKFTVDTLGAGLSASGFRDCPWAYVIETTHPENPEHDDTPPRMKLKAPPDQPPPPSPLLLSEFVDQIGLRTYNRLHKRGITAVDEVRAMSDQDLGKIPNLGPAAIQLIRQVFGRAGLSEP